MLRSGVPVFATLDQAQRWLFREILASDLGSAPRGMATREILGGNFVLTNPRCRMIVTPERRWSAPLAVGEFAWHLAGSDDLSFIAHYAPRWREFSEDGATVRGSCYGKRVLGSRGTGIGGNQWDMLVALLRRDPMSRRAVLSFAQDPAAGLSPDAKDVACATTLQFFVRDQAVYAVAYMRSNDAFWGLPYDVFLFTMLQEMLAVTLGLGLGAYHHVAGSLHLYERHLARARRVAEAEDAGTFEMPPMSSLVDIGGFFGREAAIRSGTEEEDIPVAPYWDGLLSVLRLHAASEHLGASELRSRSEASPYDVVLRPMIASVLERRARNAARSDQDAAGIP